MKAAAWCTNQQNGRGYSRTWANQPERTGSAVTRAPTTSSRVAQRPMATTVSTMPDGAQAARHIVVSLSRSTKVAQIAGA